MPIAPLVVSKIRDIFPYRPSIEYTQLHIFLDILFLSRVGMTFTISDVYECVRISSIVASNSSSHDYLTLTQIVTGALLIARKYRDDYKYNLRSFVNLCGGRIEDIRDIERRVLIAIDHHVPRTHVLTMIID